MASPFSIFRRNQKLGMAILTLMAMFAFVFLDSFSRYQSGRAGGAGEILVKTSFGDFDRMRLGQLRQTRQIANQFLQAAWGRAAQAAAESKQRMSSPQPFQFDYGRGGLDRDVILGHIFQKEAQRLGIVVSDESINGFIDQITENKLSSNAFYEITRDMQIPAKDIFDALRTELMGRYYFVYSRPQPTTPPAELWNYYCRMNVRERIEVAELPVSDFTSQIADPTDSELKAYFEAHKNRLAYEYPEMEKAGFKQPQRAELQYLKLSYEEAEKLVPEVTDQEVVAYYEANKEKLYRNRPFPETPGEGEKKQDASSEGGKPEEKPAESKSEDKPASDESSAEKSSDEKPADSKPAEEKPTEEKPAESEPEDKQEKGPTIIPDKPAPEKTPEAEPVEEKKQSRRDRLNENRELADGGQVVQSAFFNLEDKPAEEGNSQGEGDDKESPKIESDKPVKESESEPEAEKKPAEPEKPAEESKPETSEAEKTPETEKSSEEKPAESKPDADVKPEEKEPDYVPLDDGLKGDIREKILRERTLAKLFDLGTTASEKLGDIGVSFNATTRIDGDELYYDLNDDEKKSDGEPSIKVEGKIDLEKIDPRLKFKLAQVVAEKSAERLRELATSFGMTYGETGLISEIELNDLDGIGKAVSQLPPGVNPFESAQAPVRNMVFGDESVFRPLRLQEPDTNEIYVGWKVLYVPLHVPGFDDAGIKEQVLAAWKLEKAREPAEKRAQELAEIARTSGKSLLDALSDQKVTETSTEPIQVSTSPNSFSWLSTTTVPGPNAFSSEVRPEMSDVPFVKKPGEKFMKKIFEDLKPEEIGVTSDYDATHYYVVQVKDREPSAEALAEKRNDFFTGRLFGFNFGGMRIGATPYDYLSDVESQQALAEWVQRLEKSYHVEFVEEDTLGNTDG